MQRSLICWPVVVGRMTSPLWIWLNSSSSVRDELPSPARLCHPSKMFFQFVFQREDFQGFKKMSAFIGWFLYENKFFKGSVAEVGLAIRIQLSANRRLQEPANKKHRKQTLSLNFGYLSPMIKVAFLIWVGSILTLSNWAMSLLTPNWIFVGG